VSAAQPRVEIVTPSGCRLLIFVDWTPELVAELAVLLEVNE
jgi:hypothetical protein